MGNGNGHLRAAKAHISTSPHQIAGVVVHIARTGTACGGTGVVPVAFQTVVIAEIDGDGGFFKNLIDKKMRTMMILKKLKLSSLCWMLWMRKLRIF